MVGAVSHSRLGVVINSPVSMNSPTATEKQKLDSLKTNQVAFYRFLKANPHLTGTEYVKSITRGFTQQTIRAM